MSELGHVYVFKIHNFCKVGSTINSVALRRSNVDTLSPYVVENEYDSGLISNYKEVEKIVHGELASLHTHGEWYLIKFNKAVELLKKAINEFADTESHFNDASDKMQLFFENITKEENT